jgi:hypothetical protein
MLTALPFAISLALSLLVGGDSQWVLDRSTLTYHVSHPMHESEGVSHAARGKGACHAGECDFLIAVPVKSSTRGHHRDLHDQVSGLSSRIRTRLPESRARTPRSQPPKSKPSNRHAAVASAIDEGATRITAIPATLAAFRSPATLLASSEQCRSRGLTWRRQN